MGRPSVAVERRRQILEAAIRCLAAHGLAGTTLDRIADEAGMARGHVRHFAGNRDDVLTAAAVLLYFGSVPETDADAQVGTDHGTFLPAESTTVAAALDYLFGEFAEPDAENRVVLAFVEAGRTNPRINAIVLQAYTSFQVELATLLSAAYPDADPEACTQIAYGILTIAIGNLFMADIAVDVRRTTAAREAAEQLVTVLTS